MGTESLLRGMLLVKSKGGTYRYDYYSFNLYEMSTLAKYNVMEEKAGYAEKVLEASVLCWDQGCWSELTPCF